MPNTLSRKVSLITPYPFTHHISIKAVDSGKTLSEFFYERFPFKPKSEWENRVVEGLILLNGEKVDLETQIKAGDSVSHFNAAVQEPSVPDEIECVEETSEWMAVFKPAPMPIHSGGRYHKNTLQYKIEQQFGFPVFITHRLDSVTSGLVLLAKNEKMAGIISKAFRENKPQKEYLALVNGIPNEKNWIVNQGIKRKSGFVFECSPDLSEAKSAETRFTLLDSSQKKSTILCEPITGRTHQIRLHLSFSGFPIVDDWVYLPNSSEDIQLQNRAIHLCNSRLQIKDLGIDVACELPTWWGETE